VKDPSTNWYSDVSAINLVRMRRQVVTFLKAARSGNGNGGKS